MDDRMNDSKRRKSRVKIGYSFRRQNSEDDKIDDHDDEFKAWTRRTRL